MSTIKVTNLRHESASSSNITLDSSNNVTTANNFTAGGTIGCTGNLTVTSGNLVLSSGNGIDFSATGGPTNGTGSSELFDDYEEGTWTPVSSFTGGNGTRSDASNVGSYTKIGDVVTACFQIVITKGTASGSLQITGLPFTRGSGDNTRSGAYFVYHNFSSLTNGLYGYISDSSTLINLFHSNNISAITNSNMGTSTQIIGTAIYKV